MKCGAERHADPDQSSAGRGTLNQERPGIGGTDALMLVVYHPDAGSIDAEKPALLASADLPPVPRPTTNRNPDGR
jgi:hypothetical protein